MPCWSRSMEFCGRDGWQHRVVRDDGGSMGVRSGVTKPRSTRLLGGEMTSVFGLTHVLGNIGAGGISGDFIPAKSTGRDSTGGRVNG